MRLRCAACGCYVRSLWEYVYDAKHEQVTRVQPCKRCLDRAYRKGGWPLKK